MIHPTVKGMVTVEMSVEDARTLAEGMENVLGYVMTETSMPIGRSPDGQTCTTFLASLRRSVGYERG